MGYLSEHWLHKLVSLALLLEENWENTVTEICRIGGDFERQVDQDMRNDEN
jgi:hypothetical protein